MSQSNRFQQTSYCRLRLVMVGIDEAQAEKGDGRYLSKKGSCRKCGPVDLSTNIYRRPVELSAKDVVGSRHSPNAFITRQN